jgi:hypothetical protein
MTSEPNEREEMMRWLLEPPAPGTTTFVLSVGDEVPLSPEVQAAIEDLVRAVQGAEVAGYRAGAACPADSFICKPRGNCAPEWQVPCYVHHYCKINPSPMAPR